MNEVKLIGNVYKDVHVSETKNAENKYVTFHLVTSFSYKDKETHEWKSVPTFMVCKLFGKIAEKFALDVIKGDTVFVIGRINTSQHDNNGVKTYFTNIVCTDYMKCIKPIGKNSNKDYSKKVSDVTTLSEDMNEQIPEEWM